MIVATKGTVLSMSDLMDIDQAHSEAESGLVKGDLIGGAILDEPIARIEGAFVWRAKCESGDRAVVVLDPAASEEERTAFAVSAQTLSRVAAGVPIAGLLHVDFLTAAGRSWITDCGVVGGLSDIHALGWDVDRRLQLFAELCAIVDKLRAREIRGVVSPFNVLIDDGLHPILTEVGVMGSTAKAYVAPEGGDDDAASVYNLGCILWFLLAGSEPSPELEPCPDLAALTDQPESIVAVARRCLSSTPSLRYADVAALLTDLDGDRIGLAIAWHGDRADVAPPSVRKLQPADGGPVSRRRLIESQAAAEQSVLANVSALKLSAVQRVAGKVTAGGAAVTIGAAIAAYAMGSRVDVLCGWLAMAGVMTLALGLRFPLNARIACAVIAGAVMWFLDPMVSLAAFGDGQRVASGSAQARVAALRSQIAGGRADFSGASFAQGDLSAMELAHMTFEGVDFRGANLAKANLAGADLIGANLDGADLSGAELTGAALDDVKGFEDAICDDGTSLPQGWTCEAGHPLPATAPAARN